MRPRFRTAIGTTFVLGLALAGNAGAQTTAPGPYYASPSWDQTFPCAPGNCPRFVVLSNMNGDAVMDRETGLVWHKAPSAAELTFYVASRSCQQLTAGGRYGWRMPQMEELFSLLDPSQLNLLTNGPALPPGHPFVNPNGGAYWIKDRALPPFNNNAQIHILFLRNAIVNNTADNDTAAVWCVRGPGGSPTPW